MFASRIVAPTPPARTEKEDTSAHRAEYNGTMSTPLLPPPALTAWSRTATSASVPNRHIAATSPPTQKCNTQGGSGAKAVVHETQARQAPSGDRRYRRKQRERARCPGGTASRGQMEYGMQWRWRIRGNGRTAHEGRPLVTKWIMGCQGDSGVISPRRGPGEQATVPGALRLPN